MKRSPPATAFLSRRMRATSACRSSPGGLRFVLWNHPGAAHVVADVPEDTVLAVLRPG